MPGHACPKHYTPMRKRKEDDTYYCPRCERNALGVNLPTAAIGRTRAGERTINGRVEKHIEREREC